MPSPATPNAEPTSPTSELLADWMDEAARKLQRRRLLVTLAATLLGLLAGLVQAYRRPLPYEATSVLQLFFRSAPANRQGRLSKGGMTDMQELMMGRTFREDVLDRLAPADRTRLLGAGTLQPGKHEAAQRSAQASSALEGLVVEVVPSTQLMTISFASKDPHLATAVVTAAVSVAQDIGLRLRMERTARLNVSLGDRLDELERNIAEAEKQEAATQQRLGSADPSQLGQNRLTRSQRLALQPMDRHALKVARRQGKLVGVPTPVIDGGTTGPDQLLSVLREASVKARLTERLEQTRAAAFQSLESSGNQDVLEGQARGPERRELDGIRDTLGQEQTRASMLEQKVGPEEPSMQSLSAELKETRRQRQQADKNLVAAAQHDAVQAKLRADALSAAFEQRRKTVGQQVAAERREALPELSLDVDEDLDERQRLVLRSAQVNAALQASGFYVLDQPTVPRKRIARSYQISLASGAAGGLLLGVFANLVLFARARRRWTVATAAQEGWSSVAAVLPRSDPERSRPGAAPGNDLEVLRSPQSLYSTALTELQNKLEALPTKTGTAVVLLTSSSPGEGRSTTSANLAVLLARAGHRVLLMDANLHQPVLHRRFGLSATEGLSGILAGETAFREVLQPVKRVPGLDFLAAGPVPRFASRLLQEGGLEKLLHELRENPPVGEPAYRFILIDAPPVLASRDAVFLAGIVDVLLFVARYARVDLRTLSESRRLLQHSAPGLSGLVVNAVPMQ